MCHLKCKYHLQVKVETGIFSSSLQINSATNVADLNSIMNECYNYLELIGCLRIITSLSDKYLLAKDILAYHVIKRVQGPFER